MDLKKIIFDKKKYKYYKIAGVVIVVVLFLWFLVIYPFITFKGYENQVEKAARRYFELNDNQLPTGTRIKTLSVQELFDQAYLQDDFYVPLTKSPCSITESWVKVRREDGEYKYYTYLKCGVISSVVDHKGPEITLNGEEEITLDRGATYEELGVKSVVDNSDGKLNVDDVKIDASDVDMNTPGTYEVKYSINDSLNNKGEATRKVKVVSRLENVVKEDTGDSGVYSGNVTNNYMMFSGMLFRILGVDGDNVKIVAEQDVSNVNYDAIDKWLDYYYEHIPSDSRKYIVKNKYCNMTLTDENVASVTDCDSYTKEANVSILSATDLNKATAADGTNYLYPQSMSWIRNEKNENEAYTTRSFYYGTTTKYMSFNKNYNLGVRPVLTIKGDSLIVNGDGSFENPYSIGDFTKGKAKDKVNTRQSGEYISYSGMLWRIVDAQDDGTTKVIADATLSNNGVFVTARYDTDDEVNVYNPKQNGNVGYFINNNTTEYIDMDYFVNKEIEVPIYKKAIKYGNESSTKKYKVRLAAPDIYEMFTAADFHAQNTSSYWFINSSRRENTKAVMAEIGTVLYGDLYNYANYGVRPVGFLDKNCTIVRGDGSYNNPYIISK